MLGYFAITDYDWFQFLAARPNLEEVNFWRPSDTRSPQQLVPGTPVIFKLRKRYEGWIVGYGVFAKHSVLPAWLAWDTFRESNGAADFAQMRDRIERLRPASGPAQRAGDYSIGCLMLSQPIFLPSNRWVSPPSDWPDNVVQGAGRDLLSGEAARVWDELVGATGHAAVTPSPGAIGEETPRYGNIGASRPRLGQGTFRITVLDAYRACAVTGEHSLPALEAAHIRPFSDNGPRDVTNGILLRSDVHRLFDRGYVGVSPDYTFLVSDKLHDDYKNGRSYFPLAGKPIALPQNVHDHPSREQLAWHMEQILRK
jgi:putative restriction endonuclease